MISPSVTSFETLTRPERRASPEKRDGGRREDQSSMARTVSAKSRARRAAAARPKIRPSGLHELNVWQAVEPGYLQCTVDLLADDWSDGATKNGRVISSDYTLDVRDHSDARDEPATDSEVCAPACQRTDLKERRVSIEEQFDPFADHQLSALPEPLDAFLASAGAC